jgi:hypothetical protein
MSDYSTKVQISDKLVKEVTSAVKNVRGWGSVEIHIQNYEVIQITERNIRKTHNPIEEKQSGRHMRKMGA